jgi:glycosyltransferase involved in cell wall biosynthesis
MVSVAMCTYNGAAFVQEQLVSIAGQSLQPFELIVCDDRSIDSTPQIVDVFARTAEFPVRLSINETNVGFADNFARAIGLCQGDVIVLCDQDDVWYHQKLARLEETLRQRPEVGLTFSNADVVDAHLQLLGFDLWKSHRFLAREQRMVANGAALNVFLRLPVLMGASMAFRALYKDLILPFPSGIGWGHDQWIGTVISAVANVACIDECLFRYRQHSANQFGAYTSSTVAHRMSLPVDNHVRVNSYLQSVQQYQQLLQRLDASMARWPYRVGSRSQIQGKIDHLRVRATMPRTAIRRVPRVLGQLASLRYHRYSDGIWSAARDLLP